MLHKRSILCIAICLALGAHLRAQERSAEEKAGKRQQAYEQVLNLVHSKDFTFIGQWAMPVRGPRVDLTTRSNRLVVHGDSATADVPYFGRAFTGGYGSGGGISFDGPMVDYAVQTNDKKQRVIVKFRIQGKDDRYTCTLTVNGPSNASLSVISNNRQQIRYEGTIAQVEPNNGSGQTP